MNETIEPDPHNRAPPIEHEAVVPPYVPPVSVAAPPARRRGGGAAILFSLVLFGLTAAAGYYAWTNPSDQVAGMIAAASREAHDAAAQANQAAQQAAALAQQVQSLSDRMEKLEKAPVVANAAPAPAPAPAAADLGDLPKRVDDLAAQVQALSSRPEPTHSDAQAPDSGVTQQALAELSQRVGQAADADKVALQQLGERLDRIGPRVNALEQGQGTAKGSQAQAARLTRIEAALVAMQAGKPLGDIPGAPASLSRFAAVAPPSEAALRETFPALADHARKVSQPDLTGRSFWQRAFTRLQSAVTVRQGADVLVGDPASGILADAGVKVQTGDLAGAVAVLRQLTGPAATAMQGWVNDASALVAARGALADLATHG